MTERLFDKDSFCRRFSAQVLSCRAGDDGTFLVVLDKTAFFPQGGGQASDTGLLDGFTVTDVQIEDGEIIHTVSSQFQPGQSVIVEIDWDKRFSRMQKHSAEHIVSGLIHTHFGFENVGFHLGDEDVTMDFNGELTRENLNFIEDLANKVVAQDVTVTAVYPSKEELEQLSYRSKKELAGDVRIVTVDGVDCCACCAPHVTHTGQIGMIKLLDFMRYKGGVRVHLQAGFDALRDYRMRYETLDKASVMLSSKSEELPTAVLRLLTQKETAENEVKNWQIAWIKEKINGLPEQESILFLPSVSADVLQKSATLLSNRKGKGAVFSGDEENGFRFAVISENNMDDISAGIRSQLNGKGGGKGSFIQGQVHAPEKHIRDFWTKVWEISVANPNNL